MKSTINPQIIQALTPMFLAAVGCVIGVCALFMTDGNKTTAAMGLAGTAIAGASGLARNESIAVEKKGDDIKVTSPGSQASE